MDPHRCRSGVFRDGVARLSTDTKILYHADGKTATVSVIEGSGRRLLRTNGKTDASVALEGMPPSPDEPTRCSSVRGHRSESAAKRVAVIGVGSGLTTAPC